MDRIAIRVWQLRTQQRGHPEVPHRLAHRRVGAGAAHELIVFCRQHPSVSLPSVRDPSWSPASLQTAIGKSFARSEEHTSELQSLMRNSYAVFCLKKKKK